MQNNQKFSTVTGWACALSIVLVLGQTACDDSGGGADGGAPANNNPSVSAPTAQSFISSFCNYLKPCCQKAGLRTDGTQCGALLGAFVGPSNYDAKAGGMCLGDIKAAAGKPEFCADAFAALDTCESVATRAGGTKKPGETCTDDEDCAPSSEGDVECANEFVDNKTVEKCQIQLRGKEGDMVCVGTRDGSTTYGSFSDAQDVAPRAYICHVSDGLFCNAKTESCSKIQPVGGPCGANGFGNFECVATAYCDNLTDKCVARKAAGADCSSFGTECSAGHYCNEDTEKCTVQTKDGAACTTDEECTSDNCVNDKCAPESDFGLQFYCGAP